MAHYWSSKTFLPSLLNDDEVTNEYAALRELQSAVRGISIPQGQVDIEGAADMLGALQYHYQQFVRIVRKKASGEMSADSPDERYEAVAYLGRLGQFYYFADRSKFVESLISNAKAIIPKVIPSVYRLVHFRMKYVAHRARDFPRDKDEVQDVGHELALGAIGGKLFLCRENQKLDNPGPESPEAFSDWQSRSYRTGYVMFEIYNKADRIEFVMELDHPIVLRETTSFMQRIIECARRLPRD